MAFQIFIDGKEGTTGLQLFDRMQNRPDLTLLQIDDDKRKDPAERKKLMNASDVTFLCLPDEAAIEAAAMIDNPHTKVIDASTAHRLSPGWAYGFPELSPAFREAIAASPRIANPGCYATGMISIVYPLIRLGLMPTDYPVVCHAISGYSGGGKKMISAYANPARTAEYSGVRQYGLSQSHKHQAEMQAVPGLAYTPIFNPAVADFYCG
ncbi:MAG: N-acetyl-gamma-glutamyl-phosphate reductase, partial [Oscillospiraceae bacterium]